MRESAHLPRIEYGGIDWPNQRCPVILECQSPLPVLRSHLHAVPFGSFLPCVHASHKPLLPTGAGTPRTGLYMAGL